MRPITTTLGLTSPTAEEFPAHEAVVPVVRRLLADGETPVGVYRKLAGGQPGTFLLESAEQGRQWSRYSFVGVRSAGLLTERDGKALWVGEGDLDLPEDPLEALTELSVRLRTPRREGLPPLTGGLVGYLTYDAVRRMERLPSTAVDDIGMPELAMMLATDLAVLDHADGTVLLIANVVRGIGDDSYEGAVARLDAMSAALAQPTPGSVATLDLTAEPDVVRRTSPEEHQARVEVVKEHIRAGDAFQVVLSQRFEVQTDVDGLDVYRVLRASNPSPYMYLLRFAGRESAYDVVGSSPEALVTVTGDHAVLHPIAGTKPRGASPEQDAALAAELLGDPKERSEHVMLVDLGRNDLGRVCTPGSVDVVDFMQIERYSHVMHIVSTVVGTVQPDKDALDVLKATFPAGTLSGAPKPRAMEIIESLEPTRRALYGGTVGYVDASGDMDMAIAIRTAVLHQGRAYVQAGAGVVADSDAATEEAETRHKARAVLSAIATAEGLTELR
ncbi:MAG: anthranilate synthase component [Frankiales bacterium]|nr:anthranilate synthase component [Frankiales bacterium]